MPRSEAEGPTIMAYSPVEQARLIRNSHAQAMARKLGVTAAQLALAWVLRRKNIIAIPKAGTIKHVEENARAAEIELSEDTLAEIDHLFPPPTGATPLELL